MTLAYPNKSHIKITINDAISLANERNGQCLSLSYNPNTKLVWQCK